MKKILTIALAALTLTACTASAQDYRRDYYQDQRTYDRYERNREHYERRYWSRQRQFYYNQCNPRYEEARTNPRTGRRVCVDRREYRTFLEFNLRF